MAEISAGAVRWRRVAAVLVVAAGLGSLGLTLSEHVTDYRVGRDFLIDHASARAVLHGRSPFADPIPVLISRELPEYASDAHVYEGMPNWHTAPLIILHVPFAPLSAEAAGLIWVMGSAVCLIAAIMMFGDARGWSRRASVTVAFGMLATPLVYLELALGQSHAPLLLLTVLGWRAYREGGDRTAGIWLGVGAALKILPGLFLLPLLALRRWRIAAATVAAAATLTIPSTLIVGLPNVDLLQSSAPEWRASPFNMSWAGWTSRLFEPALALPMGVAGSVLFAWCAYRIAGRASHDRFWAAAPALLLAWPISWTVYFVVAVPWLLIAVERSSKVRRLIALPAGVALSLSPPSLFAGRLAWTLPTVALLAGVAVEILPGASKGERPSRPGRLGRSIAAGSSRS